MDDNKHSVPEALRLALLIQHAGRSPERWPQVIEQLRGCMDCAEVFGPPESDTASAVPGMAGQGAIDPADFARAARHCAERCTGGCSAGPNQDEARRQTCLALVGHLEMALAAGAGLSDGAARLAASHALDAMVRPIFVCDLEQRLVHANRAGHEELTSGRWLTLKGNALELVPNTHPQRLRGELSNLLRSPSDHQSHLRFPTRDGQRAELLARCLERGDDPPHLFLLRLVVLAEGRPTNGLEHIAAVHHTQRAGTDGMTPRQRELARLLLSGCNVSEAARRMGIQRSTASDHMKGLFNLSQTTRQVDLVAWLSHVGVE